MVYNQPGSRRPSQVLALTGSPEVPGHRRDHHNCDGQDECSDSRWGVQGGFSLRWRLLRNLRCVLCHHLFVNHLVLCVNCALLSSLLDSFKSFEIPFRFRCASEKVFLALDSRSCLGISYWQTLHLLKYVG